MIDELTKTVDELLPSLQSVSAQIHAKPELCFEEEFAHDLLVSQLESRGVAVQRSAFGAKTGFCGEFGDQSKPKVAIVLEYDALPGIGHGCGHNIIASAGLGAALALASLQGDCPVSVRVLGTPAEEGGGGKIVMARHGAFDGVSAAMMIHPADRDLVRMDAIAIQELRANYLGKAAHAAAAPHEGRNALDAAVLGYNAIAALRQHIRPTERLHGIFTNGGDKPNIVPSQAETLWYVRSDTLATLAPLRSRVEAALTGGATACGCTVDLRWQDFAYADMRDNPSLCDGFGEIASKLGREMETPSLESRVVGSTDMGNVSYLVPSIHPMVAITDPGTPLHTEDFARAAVGDRATEAIRFGAIAMAQLAVRIGLDPNLLAGITAEHTGQVTGITVL